jgi:hypothetical protein
MCANGGQALPHTHIYKMKYKDGRIYRRKIGQARKSQSIYDNLGHPYDIRNKEVIFIGKKAEPYSLTFNKRYVVLDANTLRNYNWCEDLRKREHESKSRRVETCQSEDYLITIINDKGHKRKYSHMMFKKAEE